MVRWEGGNDLGVVLCFGWFDNGRIYGITEWMISWADLEFSVVW